MNLELVVDKEMPAVRYCTPNRLDHSPKGTVVRVVGESGSKLFIQIRELKEGDDEPECVPMGTFLEEVFSEFTSDAEFLSECMVIYNFKQERKFLKVSEIIKNRMK
jgi:hypothetical protein